MAKLPQKGLLRIFLKISVLTLLILGIAYAVYSYNQYKKSTIEREGIVVCNDKGECEKSLHIHAALDVSICTEEKSLSKDTGQLSDIHSHKQSNVVHFHERLKVNTSGDVIDSTPLTLSNALDSIMGLKLTNNCIGDKCNGDLCPDGARGKLQLTVVSNFCAGDVCPGHDQAEKAVRERGEKRQDFADYVWQDGDLIDLKFE